MGEMINAYKILVGKPQGKRPHGIHRCGWEYNIRMTGCGMDSSVSGYGPVAGSCEYDSEPSGTCLRKLAHWDQPITEILLLKFNVNKVY
jgi:hypothetical protein